MGNEAVDDKKKKKNNTGTRLVLARKTDIVQESVM
jgi:hypothetical protein